MACSATCTLLCCWPSVHFCVQIEDAFYQLPNPYPEQEIVGVVKQTLAVVDETDQQVPLSEVLQSQLCKPPSHLANCHTCMLIGSMSCGAYPLQLHPGLHLQK